MAGFGVRREKAALSSGCKAHPATPPAGSARGACCRSRPLLCCVTRVTERDGSKMASRNGKWQGSRSARCSYRDPGRSPDGKGGMWQ